MDSFQSFPNTLTNGLIAKIISSLINTENVHFVMANKKFDLLPFILAYQDSAFFNKIRVACKIVETNKGKLNSKSIQQKENNFLPPEPLEHALSYYTNTPDCLVALTG